VAKPNRGQKLQDLLRDLEGALKASDHDRVASVRRTIVAQYPGTPEGAEASYKLGLDALFRERSPDEAAEHFRAALKAKSSWAAAARISLAIILLRQGKSQQGMFELRKVVSADPPTIASAYAKGLIVVALREAKNAKEAERAHEEHKKLLSRVAEIATGEDKALAHFMLGMEHKFDGEREPAKKHLCAALEAGGLPERERAQVEAALLEV
jgi:tetratricopeptide (TPR) repeat protein